jgi:anti-anti-sigma factor
MTGQSIDPVESSMPPLVAPTRIVSETRLEFRRAVFEQLEQAVHLGADTVDIDLGGTVEMDASGLGILVLLQKRARERGLRTRLVHARRPVLDTLRLTRLDGLFELAAQG